MRKLIFVLALLLCFPSVSHAALATSLVSYWKLDESSGNAADSVGSNTLSNTGTTPFAAAKINNGANLDGASQYFSIADASQTGLDISPDMTIAFWFKPNGTVAAESPFVAKYVAAGTRSYRFYADGAGNLAFQTSNDGTANAQATAAQALNDATWYFLAVTKSGTTATFYVNGSSIGTGTVTSTIFDSTATFYLGTRVGSGEFAKGVMDEVGIWSRALTGTEITTLYNSGNGCQYTFAACEGAAVVESIINLVFSDWIW